MKHEKVKLTVSCLLGTEIGNAGMLPVSILFRGLMKIESSVSERLRTAPAAPLFGHHLFELVQTKDAVSVRVVLGEGFLGVVFTISTAACSFFLGFLENETVLPAVLIVEQANDLKTPEILDSHFCRYSIQ